MNSEVSINVYPKSGNKFPMQQEFSRFFLNKRNKIRLQQFLKQEFQMLVNNHLEINFVYSIQSVCVNLRTTQRIADYECEHIEAYTMIFYIYS